jgi:hypothetical protein
MRNKTNFILDAEVTLGEISVQLAAKSRELRVGQQASGCEHDLVEALCAVLRTGLLTASGWRLKAVFSWLETRSCSGLPVHTVGALFSVAIISFHEDPALLVFKDAVEVFYIIHRHLIDITDDKSFF